MDKLSKAARSRLMASIRSKHTGPEIRLRKAIWASGHRYRLHYGIEKIDIAFTTKMVALFVDGCFWHLCPKHSHLPKSNRRYWVPKLKKNVLRDTAKSGRLMHAGWKVIRIWEHELNEDVNACVKKVLRMLV